jgi:hypothetical protein
MDAKQIGKILGATALVSVPVMGGFYAYGRMKDSKSSTGAASLVGGLVATILGVGVAFADYFLLGLDTNNPVVKATALSGLLEPRQPFSSAAYTVGQLPKRVYAPFHSNFRQVGMIAAQRARNLGMLNVDRRMGMINAQRVGCCGR